MQSQQSLFLEEDLAARQEQYRVVLPVEERRGIYQTQKNKAVEDLVLNTVPAVLVIALLWLGPNRFPLVVNALLTGILAAAALVRWLQLALRGRRCKQHLSSCKRECFVYWAGSYDFIVEQTQDGGWIQTQKLPYRTVRTVEDVGAYRILHANGQRFVLRKDELSQESIFLRLPLSKLPPPPAPTSMARPQSSSLLLSSSIRSSSVPPTST